MAWTKRYGDIVYEANHDGVRELGLSKVTSKAAGQAASKVVSAANSLDPKGQYSAKGIGVYAGDYNEPRNAAVVEGKWWPGANTAALKRALDQAVKSFK